MGERLRRSPAHVEEIVLVTINECREWSFACFGIIGPHVVNIEIDTVLIGFENGLLCLTRLCRDADRISFSTTRRDGLQLIDNVAIACQKVVDEDGIAIDTRQTHALCGLTWYLIGHPNIFISRIFGDGPTNDKATGALVIGECLTINVGGCRPFVVVRAGREASCDAQHHERKFYFFHIVSLL